GTVQELLQKIRSAPGGLLGIYTNLITRRAVLRIIQAAREVNSTVILGGPESANYTAEYLAAGADVIVLGEGETTLAELVATLASRSPRELQGVRGIVFRNSAGEVVRTAERPKINDLDSLPMPDREAI